MKGACFLATTAALLLLIGGTPALSANADYVEGQKLFAAKNYRAAAAKFEAAMRATPRDANAIYYCALANQMSSNRARARQLYEYISSSFPGSQIAGMAATALTQLGGAPPTAGSTGGSGGGTSYSGGGHSGSSEARSNPNLTCPDEFRVPFEKGRNGAGVYVDVSVNGHAVKFHLDTGAGGSLIGANQMAELGFERAAQGKKFGIGGVGDRDDVKGWHQTVQLRIGQATIRDFPIDIQDNLEGDPLLGQDFLRNFDTEIDPNNSQVTFRKKGAKSSSARMARGAVDVPFEDAPGGHMIVTAQVNGKPYKFYFDTGADSVAFAMKDLKPLGLEIPSDYRGGTSRGVAGSTNTYNFPIDSIKLGTMVKENFMISVVENSTMDHPLLGQSFFGNYRHKVDTAAHLIHFWPND
jgi:clan AA aspartic protease (TIGR02281 family)